MDVENFVGFMWKLLFVCCTMSFSTIIHTDGIIARHEVQNKFTHAKQQLANCYQHFKGKRHVSVNLSFILIQSLDNLPLRAKVPKRSRGSLNGIMWTNKKTLLFTGLDLWAMQIPTFIPDYYKKIRFVKVIQWQERLFLLTCYDRKCSLFYAYPGNGFSYCQPISDIPGVPIAAEFFLQGNSLFLIVLFQAEHSPISQTTLYRWQNTYMDRQPILEITTTASIVVVFGHNNNTIFILGCTNNGDDRMRFPSQVWTREADGSVRRVQYLPTWKLRSLTHFVDRGENFLLLLEDNKATIYWWKGDEFVLWMSEKTLALSSVSISRSVPTLIVFTRNNVMEMYVMNSENLEKVFENTFSDMSTISSTSIFHERENIYIIIHYKTYNAMYIQLYQINVSQKAIIGEPAVKQIRKNHAEEALSSTSNGVTALDEQLSLLDSFFQVLLFTNNEITLGPTATIFSDSIEVHSGDIYKLSINQLDIASTIRDLRSMILALQEEITSYSHILKYNQSDLNKQLVIVGDVHIKHAKINHLVSSIVNDGHFDPTALLRAKNNLQEQRIQGVKAKVLKANWLVLEHIENKPVKDLLLDDRNIRVPVYTSVLESRNVQISNGSMINNITFRDLMERNVTKFTEVEGSPEQEGEQGKISLQLQNFTVIENLYVETINSIPVNDLLNSLFVKHIKNRVNGNLHFKNSARIQELKSKNKKHKYIDENSFNEALNAYNAGSPPRSAADRSQGTRWTRDTYLTRPNKTIYAKVKIIGNLRVRNLTFQNSSLQTNNYSVPTSNIDGLFWTYNSPQIIRNRINFMQGVSLLHGSEQLTVNGINISHYATRKSTFKNLILENVHIDGDVFLQESQTKSRIQDFNQLEVKHLQVNSINGRNLQYIAQFSPDALGWLKVSASNVSVRRDLEVDLINSIDVRNRFQHTVLIDEDAELPSAVFKALTAKQAQVGLVNDLPVDSLLGFTGPEGNSSVFIKGNLHVSRLSDVLYVNNKTANLSLVVDKSGENKIYGKKKYLGQIVCPNYIAVSRIKGMDAQHMFASLLRTSTDQLISGFYSIKEATIGSLNGVKEINGIDVARLIYTDQHSLDIKGDIHFKSVIVKGNVTALRLLDDCTLPKVERNVVFGRGGKWETLRVEGDCDWSGGGRLQQLFTSAVTVDSSQTISGNITISHLFSKTLQVHSLNNENITFIFQDSLYRKKKNQVFSGKKSFLGYVKCENIKVDGDARFTYINNVKINDIDEKLVRHKMGDYDPSTPVFGHKKFIHGFKAFVLTCTEGINKIPSTSLAQESEHKLLPPLIIQSIVVAQNIQAENINGIRINDFLEDCVYANDAKTQFISHGLHIKGNVFLQGNVTTPAINNISIWDLVFTTGKYPKLIKGCQTFLTNIKIETNASVEILNDSDLSEKYKDNLKVYQNATINGSLVILPEVELETVYGKEYFVRKKPLLNLKNSIAP